MNKLLIVDDSQEIRQQLKWGLGQEYQVLLAADVNEAIATFSADRPGAVLLDLGLSPFPNNSLKGFQCLEEMLKINPSAKVVVLTGNSEQQNALKAMRMGAFDFYAKPPVLSELKVILSRAFYLAEIEELNLREEFQAAATTGEQWGMVGCCQQM